MGSEVDKFLSIYKNKTFDEVPFCEGDIVVAGYLSYCNFFEHPKFHKFDLENNAIPFDSFHTKADAQILSSKNLNPKEIKKFLNQLFLSKRYRHFKVGYMKNVFGHEDGATQFFALTVIAKKYNIIIFRGTDPTITGWKEDLDLTFKKNIPSHGLAKKYVYKIASISDKPLIIVGHSKGGHLAYYAFLASSNTIKSKIYRVYNLDGPGFNDNRFRPEDYKDKLIKIVPSSSIFGLLLEYTNNYEIIKSSKKNVDAHDLLTWEFSKSSRYKDLRRMPSLSKYSLALKIAIFEWYNKYSKSDFKNLTEFIYQVAISNKQVTALNLKLDVIKKRKIYLDKIAKYNKAKKDKLKLMSRDFVKIYFSILFHIKDYDLETLRLKGLN